MIFIKNYYDVVSIVYTTLYFRQSNGKARQIIRACCIALSGIQETRTARLAAKVF
ncbi:hypothetical protein Cal6303_5111 [Calothrix sp. PCC 6303]|nr:hypothetical protein Cal6303_5111 [Calothrix sp. PCC 6303]